MDNVYCDGSEDELSKCRFDGWGASDCEGGEAAGVICARDQQQQEAEDGVRERSKARRKPEKRRIKDTHQQGVAIRLAGGRVHSEGRVEVKLGRSGTRYSGEIFTKIFHLFFLLFTINPRILISNINILSL